MGAAAPFVLLIVFIFGTLLDSERESQVILLADPDGSVGTVEVATRVGKAVLTEAGQMTRIGGAGMVPSQPVTISQAEIESQYSVLFAAEPEPSSKFLLYFEQGSTRLIAESEQLLRQILMAIERRGSSAVGIYGHSDRTGSDQFNLQLSLQRAQAVRDLLTAHGVNPQVMDVDSHGEGNPLVSTPDGVAEPRNRRVEVIVR